MFSADLNAYIALPSTSWEEATALDEVTDHADNAILAAGTACSAGTDPAALAAVLQAAARQVCLMAPTASASCEGR